MYKRYNADGKSGGICAVFVKRLYVEKCVKIFM